MSDPNNPSNYRHDSMFKIHTFQLAGLSYFCVILTKVVMEWQIVVTLTGIKFSEYQYSGFELLYVYRWQDMGKVHCWDLIADSLKMVYILWLEEYFSIHYKWDSLPVFVTWQAAMALWTDLTEEPEAVNFHVC